jgi:hypothetical protein
MGLLVQRNIFNVDGSGGNDVSSLLLQYKVINVGGSSETSGGNSIS